MLAEISVLGMLWDALLWESLIYGIAQFKKYDPGSQCGIEYYIMYGKFAPMQKYEFLIFGIFGVQDKNYLYMFTWFYVSPEIIIGLYIMSY